MHRRTFVGMAVVTVICLLAFGLTVGSAAGAPLTLANRFAPSGTVTADPFSAPGLVTSPNVPPGSGVSVGCPDAASGNVRADQDCTNQSSSDLLGRSQSQNETAVAVNPLHPNNVLVSQNDYRKGDGACGVDWSFDGGRHWGSALAPTTFTPGFTNPRHYWNAGGDTSVGFDTSGEAYLMCGMFDRGATVDSGTDASGFFLFRSADGGASWSFPGSPVAQSDGTGADGIGLLDKEYMVIDSGATSPFRDRIYVAWTQYSTDFTAAPITFAYSDDHGVTWHNSGSISGSSADLCPVNFSGAPPGTCDSNQFANPFVAPNGDVYVAFQNFNNCAGALHTFGFDCPGGPHDNHNQMLIVKSTDGGNTFGAPVKVADFYELPDCVTYTGYDFGRACVPTAPAGGSSIFRASNYPTGVAVSDTNIVVDFGSYINEHSNQSLGNCAPAGLSSSTFLNLFRGVGTVNGCNNDIVESTSTDGGATFTGTSTDVSELPTRSAEGAQLSDQWWQWSALTPSGNVAVVYYDRKYNGDMANGFFDISFSKRVGSESRVTTLSLPPSNEFPDANGFSLFMGDYTGMAIGADGIAHPAWTDTRNPIASYSTAGGDDARVLIPAGQGSDIYTARLPA